MCLNVLTIHETLIVRLHFLQCPVLDGAAIVRTHIYIYIRVSDVDTSSHLLLVECQGTTIGILVATTTQHHFARLPF